MKITIIGNVGSDPQSRVMAVESAARAVCEKTGQDPAEAVMMLLTAAAHLYLTYSKKSPKEACTGLSSALGSAIVAADDFFKIRKVG